MSVTGKKMSLKSFLCITIFIIISQGILAGDKLTPQSKVFKDYTEKCTICHQMRNPKHWPKVGWKFHVIRMAVFVGADKALQEQYFKLWDKKDIKRRVELWMAKAKKEDKSWGVP